MPSVRTVNLIWERKVRGSYAVSRFALDDNGSVTLVLPRPLETRRYDLTRIAPDGGSEVRATFSVETLLELEASASSDSVLGMTSDDLYLLHGGSKTRFLPDRRLLFIDSALSLEGAGIVAGFSDVAGSSFALAAGDIDGKVLWVREADAPISCVALSPDGQFIAYGMETGSIRMLDQARREQWLFEQTEPVRCLACGPHGRFTVYGGAAGTAGLIEADGTRRWEVRVEGEVTSAAVSADAGLTAIVARPIPDDGTARLVVLDPNGQAGWEHEFDRRIVGLALSPNGRFIAASGRDGTHMLYEVVPGKPDGGPGVSAGLAQSLRLTEQCEDDQQWARAVCGLRQAVVENPTEVAACERLLEIQNEQSARLLTVARERADRNDLPGALEALRLLTAIAPDAIAIYPLLQEFRARREAEELTLVDGLLERGDLESARAACVDILSFAPLSLGARRRLAEIDSRRARQADAEAERLLAEKDRDSGLAALERAQQIQSTAERAARIQRVQVEIEFAEGMAAYDAKRYREAVFQFKKVLARDPGHADAKRRLNFAQRFEQDSNEALNDRFDRIG